MALCDFDAVITVQPIPAPSHLLRLIDDRRCSLRADGLPPFTATCVLVPTSDDPSIAEVCGLALAQDGAYFGWHVRALRELLNVGRACGYRRLVANTDGRLWPGWVLIVGCWSWDGAAAAVTVVEPLDETLLLPHLQADPETGATTLCEPHRWAGWPACIEAPA